eukprot:949572-Rhodomonas_salina.1
MMIIITLSSSSQAGSRSPRTPSRRCPARAQLASVLGRGGRLTATTSFRARSHVAPRRATGGPAHGDNSARTSTDATQRLSQTRLLHAFPDGNMSHVRWKNWKGRAVRARVHIAIGVRG